MPAGNLGTTFMEAWTWIWTSINHTILGVIAFVIILAIIWFWVFTTADR
jgi:hypothetical protein